MQVWGPHTRRQSTLQTCRTSTYTCEIQFSAGVSSVLLSRVSTAGSHRIYRIFSFSTLSFTRKLHLSRRYSPVSNHESALADEYCNCVDTNICSTHSPVVSIERTIRPLYIHTTYSLLLLPPLTGGGERILNILQNRYHSYEHI